MLVQCRAGLANWWGVRAAIQFISITSTEERADMQVSASDHCNRTILSTISLSATGQNNEECLLRNESWKSLSLADTSDLVLGRAFIADAAVWRLPGKRLLPGITLPVSVQARVSRALNNCCNAGRIQAPVSLVLLSCLASLSSWFGAHAAMHFISITSTEERADMQVPASGHAERKFIFTLSILVKKSDQWRVSP